MKRAGHITALAALTLFITALPLRAFRPEGQALIYANFSFINYIATSQKHVYFATTGGIVVYNKIELRWETPLTGAGGIDSDNADRIWVDRFDQHLYAQTQGGLWEYDFVFKRWSSLPELPSIDSDDKHVAPPPTMFAPFGYNYVGTGNLVDPHGRTFRITDMVDDGAGNLWIGTWALGAATADAAGLVIALLPYGLLQNPAYALLDEDSLLWVAGPMLGSPRTGVTGFDRANNRFLWVESGAGVDFPAVDVNCLAGDKANLYLGTVGGLLVMDRATLRVSSRVDKRRGLTDQNILSMATVGDSIFLGTSNGLLLLYHGLDSVVYIGQREFYNRIIYDLLPVDNALWIGSGVGAYRFFLDDNRLQKFQDPDQVLFNRVFDIDRAGRDLWLASDGGMVRIDLDSGGTEPFRTLSRKLDSRALAASDQMVAAASDFGVTVTFFNDGKPYQREFGVEDGLPSRYVYALLLDGDYLWIGTDRGLCHFWWNNPRRID
ncbi:MAG: two-component regulator propeller domain-containing protein [Candidatus Zixiibacteriota bacterium]